MNLGVFLFFPTTLEPFRMCSISKDALLLPRPKRTTTETNETCILHSQFNRVFAPLNDMNERISYDKTITQRSKWILAHLFQCILQQYLLFIELRNLTLGTLCTWFLGVFYTNLLRQCHWKWWHNEWTNKNMDAIYGATVE